MRKRFNLIRKCICRYLMSQKSVEGFHSDLSIDDRSTLDPTYTSESSVTSSTMSDEMDEPIFDEWDNSDLELESEDVGSEEVEVAISGRNVGRGRARVVLVSVPTAEVAPKVY